ncbi:MAG: transcriptional regulator, partial [bacterium]|nr:transcriptional regulator [bacterium]
PQFEQRGGQFVLTIRRKKAIRQKTPIQPTAQVEAQEAQEAQVELPKWQKEILSACSSGEKSGKELLLVAGYRDRTGNFKKGLQRLLDHQFIVRTIPDKPNSRLQKYHLTKKGVEYLRKQGKRK